MEQSTIVDTKAARLTLSAPFEPPAESKRPERNLDLTMYVTGRDVQRALGCSESAAYKHLRRATGKTGRGLLRASVEVWEEYARRFHGQPSGNNVLKRGRPKKSVLSGPVEQDRHADAWLNDIEARLDELDELLGELRNAVRRVRAA